MASPRESMHPTPVMTPRNEREVQRADFPPMGVQRAVSGATLEAISLKDPLPELPPKADETISLLATWQRSLEQKQSEQRNRIENLAAQWEQRFAALQQSLQTSLQSIIGPAAAAAASLGGEGANETCQRLGKVLSGAVDQMRSDEAQLSVLSHKVSTIEVSLSKLSEDVARARSERQESPTRGGEQGIERLARQLNEEASLRTQLAQEVRATSSEAQALRAESQALHASVGTLSSSVHRVTQDLHSCRENREDIKQIIGVVGEFTAAWHAQMSGNVDLCMELSDRVAGRLNSMTQRVTDEHCAGSAPPVSSQASSPPGSTRGTIPRPGSPTRRTATVSAASTDLEGEALSAKDLDFASVEDTPRGTSKEVPAARAQRSLAAQEKDAEVDAIQARLARMSALSTNSNVAGQRAAHENPNKDYGVAQVQVPPTMPLPDVGGAPPIRDGPLGRPAEHTSGAGPLPPSLAQLGTDFRQGGYNLRDAAC